MMDDLRALYQEVIIDHGRSPRNFGRLEQYNCSAEGVNPLCGDEINLTCYVDEDDVIKDIRFHGHGCAISIASASIMTGMLIGKSKQYAESLFGGFHAEVTGSKNIEDVDIGKLEVLSGVREFPTRVKCATLPWHTVIAALNGTTETVTTE